MRGIWLFTLLNGEPEDVEFLIDARAATLACRQSLADSIGGLPAGRGVELRSSTGQRFTTTGAAQILLRTQDGLDLSGGSQVAPTAAGLQNSIISVGQVVDKINITVFRSFIGTNFDRSGGVYRLNVAMSTKRPTKTPKLLMEGEADEPHMANAGAALVLPSEAGVEHHELTHLLFRSWCRHGVRARRKGEASTKKPVRVVRPNSSQTTCSWVKMERLSRSWPARMHCPRRVLPMCLANARATRVRRRHSQPKCCQRATRT